MRIPFLIGRAMFGGYFIMSGINHFKQSKQMAQYAAAKKVPKPDVAVKATGAMMIVGGTSILLELSQSWARLQSLASWLVFRLLCTTSGTRMPSNA